MLPVPTSACTLHHAGQKPGLLYRLLGSCQPHAGQGHKETTLSLGMLAGGT